MVVLVTEVKTSIFYSRQSDSNYDRAREGLDGFRSVWSLLTALMINPHNTELDMPSSRNDDCRDV
jgi:hypothetical protein